jgi:hypothetical protein
MLQQHEKEQRADDQEGKEEVSAQKEKICREGHCDCAGTQDSKVWEHDRTPLRARFATAVPAKGMYTEAGPIMFEFIVLQVLAVRYSPPTTPSSRD